MTGAGLPLRPSILVGLELLGASGGTGSARRTKIATSLLDRVWDGDLESASRGAEVLLAGTRVLRAAPIGAGGTILFWELLDLVLLQADLTAGGVFVRGAVVLGESGARRGTIVGPGLEHLTRVEAAISGVPRIIVDAGLFVGVESDSRLRAPHHSVPDELGYIRKLVREDSDGLWFVDYLKASQSETESPEIYAGLLAGHRDAITKGLAATQELDSAARGWLWARRYHNQVVEELAGEQPEAVNWAALRVVAAHPLAFSFPRGLSSG